MDGRLALLAREGLLNIGGLVTRYGVNVKTIRAWLKGGQLPAPTGKLGAWNTWRIADLREWEKRHPWLTPATEGKAIDAGMRIESRTSVDVETGGSIREARH